MILYKYTPTHWKIYIQVLWEQTVARYDLIWGSDRCQWGNLRSGSWGGAKLKEKAYAEALRLVRISSLRRKKAGQCAREWVSRRQWGQVEFGETSQTVQIKHCFLGNVKELNFILSTKRMSFFHTVKIVFYPDCNGNPLKGKIWLDRRGKTSTT